MSKIKAAQVYVNRENSSELAPRLPSEEEFEKPWVSQIQGSTKIPRQLAARSFIIFFVIVSVIFSFILLGNGLFVIHTALLTYSLWSPQVKFIVALVLGVIEFLGAVIVLFYLSKEERE